MALGSMTRRDAGSSRHVAHRIALLDLSIHSPALDARDRDGKQSGNCVAPSSRPRDAVSSLSGRRPRGSGEAADVGKQQNSKPISSGGSPADYSRYFVAFAAFTCLMLLACRSVLGAERGGARFIRIQCGRDRPALIAVSGRALASGNRVNENIASASVASTPAWQAQFSAGALSESGDSEQHCKSTLSGHRADQQAALITWELHTAKR
jgi:hypothetical protein